MADEARIDVSFIKQAVVRGKRADARSGVRVGRVTDNGDRNRRRNGVAWSLLLPCLLAVALIAGLLGTAAQSDNRPEGIGELRQIAASEPEPGRWDGKVSYNPQTGEFEGGPLGRRGLGVAREGQIDRHQPVPPVGAGEDPLYSARDWNDGSKPDRAQTPEEKEEAAENERRRKQAGALSKNGPRAAKNFGNLADQWGQIGEAAVVHPGPVVQNPQPSGPGLESIPIAAAAAVTAVKQIHNSVKTRADERRSVGRVNGTDLNAAKKAQRDRDKAVDAIYDAARARAEAEDAEKKAGEAEEKARKAAERAKKEGTPEARLQSKEAAKEAKAARKAATRSSAKAQGADKRAHQLGKAYVTGARVDLKQKAYDERTEATGARKAVSGFEHAADQANKEVEQAQKRLAAAEERGDQRRVATEKQRVEQARINLNKAQDSLKAAEVAATKAESNADGSERKVRNAENRAGEHLRDVRDKAHGKYVEPDNGKNSGGNPPDDPPAKAQPKTPGPKGSGPKGSGPKGSSGSEAKGTSGTKSPTAASRGQSSTAKGTTVTTDAPGRTGGKQVGGNPPATQPKASSPKASSPKGPGGKSGTNAQRVRSTSATGAEAARNSSGVPSPKGKPRAGSTTGGRPGVGAHGLRVAGSALDALNDPAIGLEFLRATDPELYNETAARVAEYDELAIKLFKESLKNPVTREYHLGTYKLAKVNPEVREIEESLTAPEFRDLKNKLLEEALQEDEAAKLAPQCGARDVCGSGSTSKPTPKPAKLAPQCGARDVCGSGSTSKPTPKPAKLAPQCGARDVCGSGSTSKPTPKPAKLAPQCGARDVCGSGSTSKPTPKPAKLAPQCGARDVCGSGSTSKPTPKPGA